MAFEGFGQAAQAATGRKFVLQDPNTKEMVNANKLLIVVPRKYVDQCPGYEGAVTDAIDCSIVVVAENDRYDETRIFNGYLKGTFKANIGKALVGKVAWGAPAPGKRPGWIWVDAIENNAEAAIAEATKWAEANQDFFAEPAPKPAPTAAQQAFAASVGVSSTPTSGGKSTLDSMRGANGGDSPGKIPF